MKKSKTKTFLAAWLIVLALAEICNRLSHTKEKLGLASVIALTASFAAVCLIFICMLQAKESKQKIYSWLLIGVYYGTQLAALVTTLWLALINQPICIWMILIPTGTLLAFHTINYYMERMKKRPIE